MGRSFHPPTAAEWEIAGAGSLSMTNTTPDQNRSEQGPFGRLLSKLSTDDRPQRAMQAVWKDAVIAESDDTVVVEGNHYFPAESVRPEHLSPSSHHSVCPWKGTASYYDVIVDGEVNRNAAWYYPQPSPAARHVTDRVAFWRGVKVRQAE
jgi:uncharacterized protein (DUF427 family)